MRPIGGLFSSCATRSKEVTAGLTWADGWASVARQRTSVTPLSFLIWRATHARTIRGRSLRRVRRGAPSPRGTPCLAAKDTQRHQLLGGRQGAMVAIEARLGRVDIALDDPHLAVRHGHHIADPLANLVADPRTEDARRDRLVAGPDPHPITHDRSPGADYVGGRARSRPEIAG